MSSLASNILALANGILHDAQLDEKQYVLSPWFTIDTAPCGLVPLSINCGTPVSINLTIFFSWGREVIDGMVVGCQLFTAFFVVPVPLVGSDPSDLGLLNLFPPPPSPMSSPLPRPLAMESECCSLNKLDVDDDNDDDDDRRGDIVDTGMKAYMADDASRKKTKIANIVERFIMMVVSLRCSVLW